MKINDESENARIVEDEEAILSIDDLVYKIGLLTVELMEKEKLLKELKMKLDETIKEFMEILTKKDEEIIILKKQLAKTEPNG